MWQTIRQTLMDINIWSILFRLLLAVVIAGALGMERRLKNRAAGFRTYILVCLGSTLVALTGLYFYQVYPISDPTRMSAQVISGIGFLGAGTIIVTRERRVEGLTTATGLWVSSAIGLALGLGFYLGAILTGILAFISFTVLEKFEAYLLRRKHYESYYVELSSMQVLPEFLKYLEHAGLAPQQTAIQKAKKPDSCLIGLRVKLRSQAGQSTEELLAFLAAYPDLTYADREVE